MLRVACGLSGGVDSSVAALLLKNKGYDVTGVFMRIWKPGGDDGLLGVCPSSGDFEDARVVAKKLDIKLLEVDFEKEYWNLVFSDFLKDYQEGRTPNPDVLCNQHIKFGYFFNHCIKKLGVSAVATGHYARTNFNENLNQPSNFTAKLIRAFDKKKDQTFFLSRIPQSALKRTLFPLGNMLKSDVRQLAKENGLLNVASKPDSMGICFIGPRNFSEFVDQYIEPKKGKFINFDTDVVMGEHTGIHHFTLGQKCLVHNVPVPYYVAYKDVPTQTIYVAAGHENPAFYYSAVITQSVHWISEMEPIDLFKNNKLECSFKYQQKDEPVPCILSHIADGNMMATFTCNSQRAITPGQYASIYLEDECLGSARIITGINDHPKLNQLQHEILSKSLQVS